MAYWLAWLALALWLGAMSFFSFLVAPTVFQALDGEAAGRFLRRVFPRYYAFGIGCSLLLLAAVAAGPFRDAPLLAGAAGLLVLAAVSLGLVPGINRARDAGAEGRQRFRRLHGLSVLLNLLGWLLALALSLLLALKGAP